MIRVGIIGGGPAGLALADDLSRAGFGVTLFEAAPELGGLARSFQFGDVRVERYYHFVCGDDSGYERRLAELGIADVLRWRPTKMGFFLEGRLYPFGSALDLLRLAGIPVLGRLRYGALVLYCTWRKRWKPLDGIPAEPWLIKALGARTYDATWRPLLHVKFNQFSDQISAAWVWHRIHRVARSRRSPLHGERLGYLEGGTDRLVTELESQLAGRGVELKPGTQVRRILIDRGAATGVETTDGVLHSFDRIVSAIPLPQFVRMAPDLPPDYRAELEKIRFIGVVCVMLRLRRPLTENFWLNVNDDRIPFNGCIEYTNLNREITPDGSSILYVPYYIPHDHPRMSQTDEELISETVEALRIINPALTQGDVLDGVVSRDAYAQVICASGFSGRVPAHQTPVENLFLIESSQLYPADRTISGTIDLARQVALLLGAKVP